MAKKTKRRTRTRTRTRTVISEAEKLRRIKSWSSAVGLDGDKVAEQLVAKYGVDQAYKLTYDAMMKPSVLAKQQGVRVKNSKEMMEHLLKGAPTATPVQNTSSASTPKNKPAAGAQQNTPQQVECAAYAPQAKKKIKNKDVETNRQLRYQYVDTKFPKLEEKDFKSHAEYVAALRKQYQEMRQFEYGLVCQQEALDMYNISKQNCVDPNKDIWTGFNKNQCDADSSYVDMGKMPNCEWMSDEVNRKHKSYASCAGTAVRVNNAISERMGYEGKNRFYQGYGYCAGGASIHNNPATKAYKHSDTSLKKMIEQGHVGPGTILSVPSSRANSGYHALTVAEVIRDKNGKITDVVLQANNNTSLRTYSVKNIDASLRNSYAPGSNKPFIVTSTHTWMDQKIQQEAKNIPEAELEARIAQERENMNNAIERLAGIEDKACGYNSRYLDAVRKQTTELNNDIAKARAERPVLSAAPAQASHLTYSEKERKDVRTALLGMDDASWGKVLDVDLAKDMRADRDDSEKQFETLMASYFAENGKGNDKSSMKLASELLTSFFMGDSDKSLASFHSYIDKSTKTNKNLNMALIYRSNGNSMA